MNLPKFFKITLKFHGIQIFYIFQIMEKSIGNMSIKDNEITMDLDDVSEPDTLTKEQTDKMLKESGEDKEAVVDDINTLTQGLDSNLIAMDVSCSSGLQEQGKAAITDETDLASHVHGSEQFLPHSVTPVSLVPKTESSERYKKKPNANFTSSVRGTQLVYYDLDQKTGNRNTEYLKHGLEFPDLKSDWRTSAALTRGSFKSHGLCGDVRYTTSFEGQKCLCGGTGSETCVIDPGFPSVIIITDNFCSPTVGGRGDHCPLVIRVDCEPPSKVLELIRTLFGKGKGQTQVNRDSTIFLCLQSWLKVEGAENYIHSMEKLEDGVLDHFSAYASVSSKRRHDGSNKGPQTAQFLVPYIGQDVEFSEAMAKVDHYLSTLHSLVSSKNYNSRPPTFLKANYAYGEMMSDGKILGTVKVGKLGGFPIRRHGIVDLFYVGSRVDLPCRAGLLDGCELGGVAEDAELEFKFWNKFFDHVSDSEIKRPSTKNIAFGSLRSGKWNEESFDRLAAESGLASDSAGSDDNDQGHIVLVGYSEAKKLAASMTGYKAFQSVHSVWAGKMPLSESTMIRVEQEVEDLQLPKDNTVVCLLAMGNDLIRSRYGEVSYSGGHHLERSDIASHEQVDYSVRIHEKIGSKLSSLGYKVVIMGPFPRYFARCCDNPQHFSANFDPLVLNEMIRDVNTFLCRTVNCAGQGEARSVVAVHAERIFSDQIWRTDFAVDRDMVHLKTGAHTHLGRSIEMLAKELLSEKNVDHWFDQNQIHDGADFGNWLSGYRNLNEGKLPTVTLPIVTSRQSVPAPRHQGQGQQSNRNPKKHWQKRQKRH